MEIFRNGKIKYEQVLLQMMLISLLDILSICNKLLKLVEILKKVYFKKYNSNNTVVRTLMSKLKVVLHIE